MILTIEDIERSAPKDPVPVVHKGTILIAEDQKGFRRVYRDVLEQDGYQVLEATNGEEAWEMIITQKPGVVLLDLGLPILDGFRVLEKARRSEQTKDIPIIIFSVLGEPRDVKKAMDMGANDYTVKGFYTPRQVLGKIKDLLKTPGQSGQTTSYRLVVENDRKGAPRLEQDLGLKNGFQCPECGTAMEAEFFPDYARADGHWFAARFVCPQCDRSF
ncbi:MAG TPA: response regulator [bacterium]|nr:response regulator [bacterium]